MVDAAHEATERKLAQMERHLRSIYSRALKEVGSGWTEYLEASAPEAARRQAAIRNATTEEAKRKAEKVYQDFLKEQTVYEARFHRLTNQLATELCHVNQTAQAYINDQLPGIYATNYNIVGTAVGQPVVWGVWELVDADTVKRLATTDETLLPYKKVNERKDVRWNTQKVNSEVMQGILQGESMPKIASRLKNVLGMNEVSAIRNARTCVTSAENGGRMDGINRLNAMGVPAKKQWLATKDSRTRHSHHDVDGEIVGPDDKFSNGLRYPGDPNGAASEVYNCRCTLLSIIDMEALGKQNTGRGQDVTAEYRNKATPGVGKIEYEDGYEASKHKSEIKTAQYIHDTYGGNITLKNDRGYSGKSPDYEWNGAYWEAKDVSSPEAADSAVRKALKQIEANPGGIVLNAGASITDEKALLDAVQDRVGRSAGSTVDVMIIKGGSSKVIRYTKDKM